jgi:dihydroxyacetone kinase
MTRIFNDPDQFVEDAIEGFCSLYPEYVTAVPGGLVRAQESNTGKVSVVVGGGSGHYPAFYGIVGPGFADGAVVGNVFTSPSAQDAISVASASDNGGGVVITSGNYAGDVLHFTEAAETLTREGLRAETIFVTDDIASAPKGEEHRRRGIAGGFVVFKLLSAAAEAGYSIDEVVRVGKAANDRTRTLGVAFAGCTLPGENSALFTVPEGKMAVGLGIHGEPGVSEENIPSAQEVAFRLVEETVSELALKPRSKVGVIVNGLGATKHEELFILWSHVKQFLEAKDLQIVDPEVGELVTSLDMAGLSLTLVALDDELEGFWRAGANTPAFKKAGDNIGNSTAPKRVILKTSGQGEERIAHSSSESRQQAKKILEILKAMEAVLVPAQAELGRIDAVAGDGDHGRGMVKGIRAAVLAADAAVSLGSGARQTLELAGASWSGKAGGTSGALWGVALIAMGSHFTDEMKALQSSDVLSAVSTALAAIVNLGKARVGDKTMVDALSPFVDSLRHNLGLGQDLFDAWALAAADAVAAAEATSALTPKIGRARPLAEKSIGTPDAGATSLAIVLVAVGKELNQNYSEFGSKER